MITKCIKAEQEKELKKAAEAIQNGKLVIFPTETVYGIGANALNKEAVEQIFMAKGRAQDNPLIVHIAKKEMLTDLVTNVTPIEQKLMDAFWPGPFTIILEKRESIPDVVSAGLSTVGIRMPDSDTAKKLIEYANVPIAAPSANISGKPSGTNLQDIKREFWGKVEYMIDGGWVEIGVESTVVRVIDEKVHLLRPGKITPEQITKLVGDVIIDKHILGKLEKDEIVRSPGMKYRHYAPNTECVLVMGEEENMINKINELICSEENILVLAKTKNIDRYHTKCKLAMGNTLEEISQNLFTLLRKVDNYNVDRVLIEGVKQEGLGLAILNRLLRACEYHVIAC